MNRKKLRSWFHSRMGETLVETLVGVLIVAMASSIIFAGVATSVRVNREAREKRGELKFTYMPEPGKENEAAEVTISGEGFSGKIQVTEHADKNDYVWFELK